MSLLGWLMGTEGTYEGEDGRLLLYDHKSDTYWSTTSTVDQEAGSENFFEEMGMEKIEDNRGWFHKLFG